MNTLAAYHRASAGSTLLTKVATSENRANAQGDPLEEYVRDIFAGDTPVEEAFSYMGGANNPPDGKIRGGNALEVKKIASNRTKIQFNSSRPKATLCSSDSRITRQCRECEGAPWEETVIYAVGQVVKNEIRELWLVHSDVWLSGIGDHTDYMSDLRKAIAEVSEKHGVELRETNEIAVSHFDDGSSMRMRGMWTYSHPAKLVEEHIEPGNNLFALISREEYYSMLDEDPSLECDLSVKHITIGDQPAVFLQGCIAN